MKSHKIKPSFDTNRQILGEIFPLDTPFTIIIDSSELCNFRCSYCFRSDTDMSHWGYAKLKNNMSWLTFEKTVAQIKEFPHAIKTISLSNHGEPLCNPQLPQMVEYIKAQGIEARVSIHTNASLLRGDMLHALARTGIDRIVVSLQGLSSSAYQKVCGHDLDFEQLIECLVKFYHEKRNNTQLCVKVADVALSEGEEQLFYQLFEDKCDRMFIEKIVPIWMNCTQIEQKQRVKNKYGFTFDAQKMCPLIFDTIVVSPDGDVYPCTQLLTPHRLGNIHQTPLVELWNSSQRRSLLKQQCAAFTSSICQKCYIRQNSIQTKEDMLDAYRKDILNRLNQLEK